MLGELFFIARHRAGYTQADAAHHADITQPYLSMIEHNRCTPRPDVRTRLCTLYHLDEADVDIALSGRKPRGRCQTLVAWLLLGALLP
jgi:transcriptional regulator with XRE-family HTH domain